MHTLHEWITPVAILIVTIGAKNATSWLLTRSSQIRHFGRLKEVIPAFSNLIYLIGLKMFVDTAPVHPKIGVWIENAIYVLGVLIVLSLIRKAAFVAIEWSTQHSNNSATLQQGFIPLLKNVITLFIFFSAAIMILKHFNYDVMSLLTALGVGSLAVGLAAKDTLSNMISGFTLIIDRNLKPGDRVNLGGSVGDVEEIGLRSTRIRTGNGNMLIVPNAELVNTKLLNLSQPARTTACSTFIRVPYTVPFARIKQICMEILSETNRALPNKGKWVNLASLSEGMQVIQIGFWINDLDDEGAALSEVNEKILQKFHQEQIPLISWPLEPPHRAGIAH
jgi:small-conductance mechanosensitive channel